MTIQPTSAETRIRGIQTHERGAESVTPRQRVACNLGGVSVREVGRGSLLVKGDPWTETSRFLAAVRPARYAELDERGAFHVHMGSGAWPARLQLIDDQTAVLHLDRPAPTVFGAPFVLRESGRRLVTGGGRVLDPQPARRRAHIVRWVPALRRAVDRDEAASALLDARGRATPRELARDTAGGEARGAVGIGPELYSAAGAEALVAQGSALLDAFHRDYPLRAGMPVASLAEALDLTSTAIDDLASLAGWSKAGAAIALRGHDVALSPTDSAAWQRLRGLLGASWRVPRIKELGAEPELLAALLAQGRLVRVSDDLVFLPEQLEQIEAKLRAFSGSFTVSEFRQELDLSRKYAVPLLEWFDGQGVTRRQGDVRVVRPQATNDHRRPEA